MASVDLNCRWNIPPTGFELSTIRKIWLQLEEIEINCMEKVRRVLEMQVRILCAFFSDVLGHICCFFCLFCLHFEEQRKTPNGKVFKKSRKACSMATRL